MSFSKKQEAFFRFAHIESIFKDKIKDFKETLEIEIDTAKDLCLEFGKEEEKINTSLMILSNLMEKDLVKRLKKEFEKLKEEFDAQEEDVLF